MWARYSQSALGWMTTPRWTGIAILCFFLPWLEIRCQSHRDLYGKPGEDGDIRIRQSGLQSIYGGYSKSVKPQDQWVHEKGVSKPVPQPRRSIDDNNERRPDGCPLIAVYGLALVVLLVVTLNPATRDKHVLASWTAGIAAGSLLLQTAIGFPAWLKTELPRTYLPAPFATDENYVAFTIWFWASWIAVIGAFVTAIRSASVHVGGTSEASREARSDPPLQTGDG